MRPDDQAGIGWDKGGGSRRGSTGRRWSPLAVIVAANIAVFVVQGFGLLGEYVRTPFGEEFYPFGEVSRAGLFEQGKVWTLFTYMFVHGNLLHILFNLILIYAAGRMLLHLAGPKHFMRVYFLSGLLGALLQMAFLPNPLVGASACGFGLLVALATMIPEQEVRMLLYFVLPVRLRMKSLAYGLVGVSVLFFVIDLLAGADASIPMVSGVGHAAHLGGALMGWLYVRQTGLGGRRVKRVDLTRQRAKNDRKVEKKRRRLAGGSKRAKIVSISDGKAVRAEAGPKDPARAENDEILDRMNREGRGVPTEEEREILERNATKLQSKKGG